MRAKEGERGTSCNVGFGLFFMRGGLSGGGLPLVEEVVVRRPEVVGIRLILMGPVFHY